MLIRERRKGENLHGWEKGKASGGKKGQITFAPSRKARPTRKPREDPWIFPGPVPLSPEVASPASYRAHRRLQAPYRPGGAASLAGEAILGEGNGNPCGLPGAHLDAPLHCDRLAISFPGNLDRVIILFPSP